MVRVRSSIAAGLFAATLAGCSAPPPQPSLPPGPEGTKVWQARRAELSDLRKAFDAGRPYSLRAQPSESTYRMSVAPCHREDWSYPAQGRGIGAAIAFFGVGIAYRLAQTTDSAAGQAISLLVGAALVTMGSVLLTSRRRVTMDPEAGTVTTSSSALGQVRTRREDLGRRVQKRRRG